MKCCVSFGMFSQVLSVLGPLMMTALSATEVYAQEFYQEDTPGYTSDYVERYRWARTCAENYMARVNDPKVVRQAIVGMLMGGKAYVSEEDWTKILDHYGCPEYRREDWLERLETHIE